jgi:hypothetical protein
MAIAMLFLSIMPSFAHKIVLLTSLDPEENRPPLRFRSWNINEKLEKRFNKELKKFPTTISKEVVHFATASDLYKALKDTEAVAVIWVGHAGFSEGNGLSSLRSIVDYQGNDLKSIFQAVGPQLKYLGLVGCRGKLFLNEWQEKGFFKHVPSLVSYGREVRTDARKGLKLAMRNLKDILEKNRDFLSPIGDHSEPIIGEYYQRKIQNPKVLSIKRNNLESKEMAPVQILQKDRLIGFLPKGSVDQETLVILNKGERSSDLKIINESGAPSSILDINLGELAIEGSENEQWNLFKTSSGKPIGVGKHIYRHKILN